MGGTETVIKTEEEKVSRERLIDVTGGAQSGVTLTVSVSGGRVLKLVSVTKLGGRVTGGKLTVTGGAVSVTETGGSVSVTGGSVMGGAI